MKREIWEVVPVDEDRAMVGVDGESIGIIDETDPSAPSVVFPTARARMIAAAPALYRLANDCLGIFGALITRPDLLNAKVMATVIEEIHAAVRAVEGEGAKESVK